MVGFVVDGAAARDCSIEGLSLGFETDPLLLGMMGGIMSIEGASVLGGNAGPVRGVGGGAEGMAWGSLFLSSFKVVVLCMFPPFTDTVPFEFGGRTSVVGLGAGSLEVDVGVTVTERRASSSFTDPPGS